MRFEPLHRLALVATTLLLVTAPAQLSAAGHDGDDMTDPPWTKAIAMPDLACSTGPETTICEAEVELAGVVNDDAIASLDFEGDVWLRIVDVGTFPAELSGECGPSLGGCQATATHAFDALELEQGCWTIHVGGQLEAEGRSLLSGNVDEDTDLDEVTETVCA